jgi:hypothetical protein
MVGAKLNVALVVRRRNRGEKNVNGSGSGTIFVLGFEVQREEVGEVRGTPLVHCRPSEIAYEELEFKTEGFLPSGLEPSRISKWRHEPKVDSTQALRVLEQCARQDTRARDRDEHEVSLFDELHRLVCGDQPSLVILAPVHERISSRECAHYGEEEACAPI